MWVADSEIHDPNHVLQLQLDYYQTVVRYVHELLNNKDPARTVYRKHGDCTSDDDCWTMSVTGHSLGGGMASIVGATVGIPVIDCVSCHCTSDMICILTNWCVGNVSSVLHARSVQSVAFSGPGLIFSKGEFTTDIDGKVVQPRLANAVELSTNFIPTSDRVPRFDGHMGSVVDTVCSRDSLSSCHDMGAHICELIYRCGDGQNQTRFRSCNASHDIIFDPDQIEDYVS